jgi:DNA mismatch repair protein MSH5
MINSTIDFDQSKSRSRPSVLSGIDTQLDKLKRRYDGMGSFLTSAVNRVNQNLPEWARQYIRSCIFLPQLGFLMEVETDPTTGNGMYEGEGAEDSPWEKLFTAEGAVCYKNGYMKELDDAYGDMYCEIGGMLHYTMIFDTLTVIDREVEIIHGLSNQVLQYAAALTKASDICGEFDAIFALASGAKKYGLVAPRMTSQNILSIQNGRHLLQELVVPSFVTNDCDLSGYPNAPGLEEERDIFQALLITGPNNSGKSVYLKQVAIIVYLAHIGSFVPASAATIGLTDKIYTRLSTTESYSRNESAFAIDLKQVDKAVKNASSRSLILIDEFGKGTNADDGAGLLAGLLAYFLAKSREANPRLLVVTHFHELIEGNYLQSLQRLGMVHMDVRADRNVDPEGRQVTYLFKLIAGYNLSSFGSSCAQSSGVPDAVVQRASLIAQLLACNEDLGLTCAKLSKKEESQLEEAELVARQFLQCDFQSLQPSNLGTGSGLTIKSVLKRMLFPEHETNSFLN